MSERRRHDLLTPLLVALGVILLLAFWVFQPFILVFSVAACVALLLAPVQKRLSAALGTRPTLAAAALVLVTTVLILLPVLMSLFVLVQQASLFLDWLRTQPALGPEAVQRFWQELPHRSPGCAPGSSGCRRSSRRRCRTAWRSSPAARTASCRGSSAASRTRRSTSGCSC